MICAAQNKILFVFCATGHYSIGKCLSSYSMRRRQLQKELARKTPANSVANKNERHLPILANWLLSFFLSFFLPLGVRPRFIHSRPSASTDICAAGNTNPHAMCIPSLYTQAPHRHLDYTYMYNTSVCVSLKTRDRQAPHMCAMTYP